MKIVEEIDRRRNLTREHVEWIKIWLEIEGEVEEKYMSS